jgi:hypothetical protein
MHTHYLKVNFKSDSKNNKARMRFSHLLSIAQECPSKQQHSDLDEKSLKVRQAGTANVLILPKIRSVLVHM